MTPPQFTHTSYRIAWLCALAPEMAAARASLDTIHADLPTHASDTNSYILGQIGQHNIVIAGLPSGEYGLASAATVTTNLLSTFRGVKCGLLVGIGGGVPFGSGMADVRLGDVVVSRPASTHGGVLQHDYGKMVGSGGFERTGMLNRPPQNLLTALTKLQTRHDVQGSQVPNFVSEMRARYPRMQAKYTDVCGGRVDRLFKASYAHPKGMDKCEECDPAQVVSRPDRMDDNPVVHYGLIASGNTVVKDSQFRDRLGREYGVLCVEMEAAGLMNNFPCLVIRGICDYADSHKNKNWQGYAASVAAAYAKELLLTMSSSGPSRVLSGNLETYEMTQRMNCSIDRFVQVHHRHTMDYCTPLDTNQHITAAQRDQFLKALSGQQIMDPVNCLRQAATFSRRYAGQSRSEMTDTSQFWLHPRFRKWESSSENDLVLIKGDYKNRFAVRSFCVNLIELVRKEKAPIVWVLRARSGGPMETSVANILKDLVCQILELSGALQREKDASVYFAQLQTTQEPMQWMGLVGKALSSLPRLYVLVEVDLSGHSSGPVSASEKFSWVNAFLRLFDELNRRGCRTRVKVVLVAPATAGVPSESQPELKIAEQHQCLVPTHHRRSGGRSVPRGTLLVRRKKHYSSA